MRPPATQDSGRGEVQVRGLLDEGLRESGLEMPPPRREMLLALVTLLLKWNRIYNLTAIEQPEDIVRRHLLDSLSLLPFLQGSRTADIGSGAGFPGLPLAIARPDVHFGLIESRDKRVRFLRQAATELGLTNVEVVAERAEKYRSATPYDTVVARAFGSIADLLRCAGHLVAPTGTVLAMKGVYPAEELSEISAAGYTSRVVPVRIPHLEAARHIVVLARP